MSQFHGDNGFMNARWAERVLGLLTKALDDIKKKRRASSNDGYLDQCSEFELCTAWSSFLAMTCDEGPFGNCEVKSLRDLSLSTLSCCDLSGSCVDLFQYLEESLCTDQKMPRLALLKCFVRFIGTQLVCEILHLLPSKTVRNLAFAPIGVKSLGAGSNITETLLSAYCRVFLSSKEVSEPNMYYPWTILKEYGELTSNFSLLWRNLGTVVKSHTLPPDWLGSESCGRECAIACNAVVQGAQDVLAAVFLLSEFLIKVIDLPQDEISESRSRLRRHKHTDCEQLGETQPEDLAALSKARITATVSRIAQLSLVPWLDHNNNTVRSNPHFQSMFAYVLEHSTRNCSQTFREEATLRLGLILVATCLITENDQIQILPLDGWISMFEDRLEQVEDWKSMETQIGEFISGLCFSASCEQQVQFDCLIVLIARLLQRTHDSELYIEFLPQVITMAAATFAQKSLMDLKSWCKRVKMFVRSKTYSNVDFQERDHAQIELFLKGFLTTKNTRALIADFWQPSSLSILSCTPARESNMPCTRAPELTPRSPRKRDNATITSFWSPTIRSPQAEYSTLLETPRGLSGTTQTSRASRFLSPRQSMFRVREGSPTPQRRPSTIGKRL